MGMISTKCESLLERPQKRLRTDDHELDSNICRGGQQKDPEWNDLPYVVLLEIYRLVSTEEKLRMSLTCKAWLLPFSRPSIWRRGCFRFNGVDDRRAIFFAYKTGCGLRHVTVDCAAADSDLIKIKDVTSAANVADLIKILMATKNKSLATFEVTNTLRLAGQFEKVDLLELLKSLLKEQTNLHSLSFINAGLTCDQSVTLLGAVSASSGARLERVEIVEYSLATDNFHEDGRFLCFIETFTNLSELSLSYAFLSDDLLFLLSRPTSEKLRFIKVWVSHRSLADSKTSPEAWDCLVARCPHLRAEYVIWGRSDDQSLCNILTRKLPLNYLFWDNGYVMDSINTRSCLTYIRYSFQNHLQQLHLEFPCRVNIEHELADIVEGCPMLEILTIKSTYLNQPLDTPLVRAVRRVVNSHPASRLRSFAINDRAIELKESALTAFIDWLFDILQ